MTAPLSPEQEKEIRADLDAVPAPPWRWIGVRGCGGPQLVTDHSGRQYLLRAAKPTDHRGDELLDPETDSVVYGDLKFRDQREGEKYSTMRAGNDLAIGRTEYDPHCIVGVANPIARWIEKSAAYAQVLLAEVDRLRAERDQFADRVDTLTAVAKGNKRHVQTLMAELEAAARADKPSEGSLLEQRHALLDLDPDSVCREFPGATCPACPPREYAEAGQPTELTIYQASHDSIVMGLYTTAAEARAHCVAEERRSWAKGTDLVFDWIEDEEDGVAELVTVNEDGETETITGYIVTPLTVASAYDEEADE